MTAGLRIKQVVDATGFTAATLRYYEQLGLLPESRRTPAGYRLYDQGTLARLAFIARAKQLGCSLEEIAGLTTAWDGGECGPIQDQLRELVAAKIDATQRQIAELVTFAGQLEQAAAALSGHRPAGACDADCGCVSEPAPGAPAGSTVQAVSLSAKPPPGDGQSMACTLAAGSIQGRLAEWQGLLSHVDRREEIDGGIRCVLAASVPTDELLRLVAAERECCPFFRFSITIDTRGVGLEVRAPDAARSIVESMFGSPA